MVRDGFAYMGFSPPILWIKESKLDHYRTEEDVNFHMLNVGDQFIEQWTWGELRLVTVTKVEAHVLTVKRERIIVVKGQ